MRGRSSARQRIQENSGKNPKFSKNPKFFKKFPVGLPGYPRGLPGATGKFSKIVGFFEKFGFFSRIFLDLFDGFLMDF